MSVTVGRGLVVELIRESAMLKKAYKILECDQEVQSLLRMSNVMAVNRLMYNDHGVVHARIVSGSALKIFELLVEYGVTPSSIVNGITESLEEAKLIVLIGAYLHDVGNAIHRSNHNIHGCILSKPIIDRILLELVDRSKVVPLRQEILHVIYSHDESVKCLSVEAGCVKIADGTDMAEGRARIPYKLGKMDIHAVSALSIKKIEIERGETKPVRIKVFMKDNAGIFQIERVLMEKILTSALERYVEVVAYIDGRELKSFG